MLRLKGHDMPNKSAPVDLIHLSRRTAGDRALEREVLGLFVRQCDLYLHRFHHAPDGEAKRVAAHALVGSARAVGAFDLADAAGTVERDPLADCGTLDREVHAASSYVAELLQDAH